MRMPIFTSFILIVLLTQFAIRRSNHREQSKEEDFWNKELEANSTRRKSLDGLNYIKIPANKLPWGSLPEDDEVIFCEKTITNLMEQKIVNLTGFTNPELKLEYAAPNTTELTAYDQNYTTLVTNLQTWGQHLYNAALYEEALMVLEFAASTRTDVSATYKLLCDMYQTKLGLSKEMMDKKIEALIPIAESLKSLSRDSILNYLNSFKEAV